MIFEFAGPPASGKSTYAKLLSERIQAPVVKISSRRELLFLNILSFIKHPLFFTKTLFVIFTNSTNGLLYYKFMNILLHHNARHEKALRLSRAIIDEGHIQNVYALFETKLSKNDMLRYIKQIPYRTTLILIDPETGTGEEYSKHRGYFAREQFLSTQEILSWRNILSENHKTFLSILPETNLRYTIFNGKGTEAFSAFLEKTLKMLR